jgi:hypothetical protein
MLDKGNKAIGIDLYGKPEKLKKLDTLNHDQRTALSSLLRHLQPNLPNIEQNKTYQEGTNYLSGLLNQSPEAMQKFEAPYLRQFNEQTVPGLAEQFSGMGAQNSSAFGQTMGSAASGLQENLAALRGGLGLQASQQGFGYSQLPFAQALEGQELGTKRTAIGLGTPAFGYNRQMGQPGFMQGLANGGGGGILSILSKLIGM